MPCKNAEREKKKRKREERERVVQASNVLLLLSPFSFPAGYTHTSVPRRLRLQVDRWGLQDVPYIKFPSQNLWQLDVPRQGKARHGQAARQGNQGF